MIRAIITWYERDGVTNRVTGLHEVAAGCLTAAQACSRHQIAPEELLAWRRDFDAHGLPGLRVTRMQTYHGGEETEVSEPSSRSWEIASRLYIQRFGAGGAGFEDGYVREIANALDAARAEGEAKGRRTAIEAERERIAAAIDGEADLCPCAEDAKVLRETALLVRADFSYEDAERLESALAEPPAAEEDRCPCGLTWEECKT